EMGWSTCDNSASGCYSVGVSPAQQADFVTQAYAKLAHDYPWVAVALVYNFRDDYWLHDNSSNWEADLGMLRSDFTPKPAYEAFKSYATGKIAVRGTSARTPTRTRLALAPGARAASGTRSLRVVGRVVHGHSGTVVIRLARRVGGHWKAGGAHRV